MTPVSLHEGRKIVRHTSRKPTPFLLSLESRVDTISKMAEVGGCYARAVDIGCGNGRNSEWLKSKNWEVVSFDLKPDYGVNLDLERQDIPVFDATVNLVLLQYVLMFLDPQTISRTFSRALALCSGMGMVVIETADVKSSRYSAKELSKFLDTFEQAARACLFDHIDRRGLKLAFWRF